MLAVFYKIEEVVMANCDQKRSGSGVVFDVFDAEGIAGSNPTLAAM